MKLHITFELNKKLDKEMALTFLDIKGGGVDFSQGVTTPHPEIKNVKEKSEQERKETINDYFDRYYKEHESELLDRVEHFRKDWEPVENKFIEQINKIFKNPETPEGKYIGYLSIINCNPRFLNNKTFQIFFKHRLGSNSVVAHEVLHFFFYDYADRNHSDIFAKLNPNDGIYWNLAELFNDVILDLPEFIAIHGQTEIKSYPAHEKHQAFMKKLWNNKPDIDNWIVEAYKYLNSN